MKHFVVVFSSFVKTRDQVKNGPLEMQHFVSGLSSRMGWDGRDVDQYWK